MRRAQIVLGLAAIAAAAAPARAQPVARIAAIAAADDARRAVVIGRTGEVYEPDGKGAWVHRLPSSTAAPVVTAGRAGSAVVALGGGAVYRLAANGWSAIRLVQRGKAILGRGSRALAAVGRQLYALEGLTRGEPTKLATAPGNVVAIGAGPRAIVVATDAGVFRLGAGKPVALKTAPRGLHLISDRWAITDRGAFDLAAMKLTAWPAGLTVAVAATGPGDALVAVGAVRGNLELVTVRGATVTRDPIGLTGTAVGVVVDRAGRAVVALADGRLALRDRAGWTTTEVSEAPPPAPTTPDSAGPATSN